jgi:hypothetical protein
MLWRMLKTMMYQTTCGVALLQRLPLSFSLPFCLVKAGADSLCEGRVLTHSYTLFFPPFFFKPSSFSGSSIQ